MRLLNESFNDASHTGDAFANMAKEVRGEEKWYRVNWNSLKEWKTLYTITACTSFLFLLVFGIVTMVVSEDCVIEASGGRCCECLDVNASRLVGQEMIRETGYNSLFYGIIMILNSLFGFYYIVVGVKTENKYQLSCMIVTQVLEVTRALFDTWFETNPALKGRATPREVLAYGSLGLLVVSGALIPPLYKQFGWSIFRRGGVLKPVRERYKIYQMFRAFNRLDVQSSTLLFIVFGLYLQFVWKGGWWIFVCILICDVLASRYMVRYLKREIAAGFYVTLVSKTFVVIWWLLITAEYISCRSRYLSSLADSASFWEMNPYPAFESVRNTYNGASCLAPHTRHDDRTLELILLNLAQAVLFRVGSMVYGFRVAARFGGGLKTVFYRELALANSEDDAKRPEGGQAVKFVAKKKQRAKNKDAGSSNSSGGNDNDDQELNEATREAGEDSVDYQQYKDDDRKKTAGRDDDEEEEDEMMREHGVSTQEMRDDLGW